jgi:hypothetical protein
VELLAAGSLQAAAQSVASDGIAAKFETELVGTGVLSSALARAENSAKVSDAEASKNCTNGTGADFMGDMVTSPGESN